jgi:hypothetical protein
LLQVSQSDMSDWRSNGNPTSIPKMGKCYPIIHFLDFNRIPHLYSQPNHLMARAIKKVSRGSHQSPQSHFAVPTIEGMALGPSPVRTLASLAAHRANAHKYTGPSMQAARRAAGRSPRRPRQGAKPKPSVLTIKAGMWFCFKGIVLATPPSIKDSDGDPGGGAARLAQTLRSAKVRLNMAV